eukprot:scaffold1525_cov142-Cylindrotheca_fusiformis.AAC.61
MTGLSQSCQEISTAVAVPRPNVHLFSSPDDDSFLFPPADDSDFCELSSNDENPLSFTAEHASQELHDICQDLMKLCQPGRPHPLSILSLYSKLQDFDENSLKLMADDLVIASLGCIRKYRWNHNIILYALDMLQKVFPGSPAESMMALLLTKITLMAMSFHKQDFDIQDMGMSLIHYTVIAYGHKEGLFLAFCQEGGVEILRYAWKVCHFEAALSVLSVLRSIAVVNHKRFGSNKTSFTDPMYVHTRLVLLRLPKGYT